MTPFGDEERMSLSRTYVPAARTSVTGITFCAVKVGLLMTCQMDCRDIADWLLIQTQRDQGDRSWPNVRRDQKYKVEQNCEEQTQRHAVRHAR